MTTDTDLMQNGEPVDRAKLSHLSPDGHNRLRTRVR